MTDRISDLIRKLESNEVDVLQQVPPQIAQLKDLSSVEKVELTKAFAHAFYRFQTPEPIATLKLALAAENQIANFGNDILPFLLSEIVNVDAESAAYHARAMSKVGSSALELILYHWQDFKINLDAHLNLIQTLSYFKLPEVEQALPVIVDATAHEDYYVRAMALFTMSKWVARSRSSDISPELKATLLRLGLTLEADAQPLVRKNSIALLGQLARRDVLALAEKRKVHAILLSITGKDERTRWDTAFVVRQEAAHYLKYFTDRLPVVHGYNQTFRIVTKTFLCTNTFHYIIEAPFIARKIEAGQFIIIRPHSTSERIPLSVCGWNRAHGTIQIIVSTVGKTSTEINLMEEGDAFKDIVGPLGERSHLPKSIGTCVVIGGGYGTGAIIPTAADLKARGNKVIGIVGARSRSSLIMIDELREVCDRVIITTNDGTRGRQGIVTEALRDVLSIENVIHVLAVGPVPMMRAVSEMTKPCGVETFVSLNAIMVDGTGMCGACRVSVDGQTKFACFHGPDFNGHLVDFDNLMKRQKMFVQEEKIAIEKFNDQLKHAACEHH